MYVCNYSHYASADIIYRVGSIYIVLMLWNHPCQHYIESTNVPSDISTSA